MGERSEALFKGGSKWFSGKIVGVNRDDSYDVEYDDGDFEKRLPCEKIRRRGGASKVEIAVYKIGDRIEALFKGGSKWFPGKIVGVNRDDSYDVEYDDGDFEKRLPCEKIRRRGGA